MLISPSILNADTLNLATDIRKAAKAGITRFHIDIMDAHFVPNLSYGPQLVRDFKREFPLIEAEIHLMSDNLKDMIPSFVEAGCDILEFHYEAVKEIEDIDYWLDYLAANGVKTGLVLNPDTDVDVLSKYVEKLDQVLVMTVYPGFGGQKFISESPKRISDVRCLLDQSSKRHIPIEVDGGINAKTAKITKAAGAEIFVAGSYIFGDGDIAKQVVKLTEVLK